MGELKIEGNIGKEDFLKLFKKCKDLRMRERYHALYLGFMYDWHDVSVILGKNYETILAWVRAYNKYGLEGIEIDKQHGRPSRLTEEQKEELKRTVQCSPRSIGLKFSNWNCRNLSWWIFKKFHIKLCKEAVRRILHKLGFVLIKPVYKYVLADKKERTAFLDDFKHVFSNLSKKDILLFLDESTVKQHPNIRAKWVLKGTREYVKTFGNHAKTYVFGAVCHAVGKVFHMKSRKMNSEFFMKFVNHLIAMNPEKKLVIVLDNAPWHKSKKSLSFLEKMKKKIDVLWLPTYSPDFNPIEHLWNFMKSIMSNFFFPTMKELNNTINYFFKGLYRQKEKIMTLCSPEYLVG